MLSVKCNKCVQVDDSPTFFFLMSVHRVPIMKVKHASLVSPAPGKVLSFNGLKLNLKCTEIYRFIFMVDILSTT